MPELAFAIAGIEIERHAVSPTLRFRIEATASAPVENIALQCQLRIEPTRRAYAGGEHEKLSDLFGEAVRWGDTLKSFLWTIVPATVPAFDGKAVFDMLVPCSFDFEIAVTKYFHGLESGEVPIAALFSGSVFYRDADDRLQISQIFWSNAVNHRLPAALWQRLMDQYHPNSAWLRLDRETFEKLYRFKRRLGAPNFERALERLMAASAADCVQ